MNYFISCDWGTSSLRLKLVDTSTETVLKEITSDNGTAQTHESWIRSREQKSDRLQFYLAVLEEQLETLQLHANTSLDSLPIVISGMASSSIGMLELPYKEIPFKNDGNDLETKIIKGTGKFNHDILLISGVRQEDDAMRGEEVQMIGCINDDNMDERLFIIPGTHSKHILVKKGRVVSIKTFMTGEFFNLLSSKSILSGSIIKPSGFPTEEDLELFRKAVDEGSNSNLLNSSFKIRTRELFGKQRKEENYAYLSGLLIGTEISELANRRLPITVLGDELQRKLYGIAFQTLKVLQTEFYDADKAIVNGHIRMFILYKQELGKTANTINQQPTT